MRIPHLKPARLPRQREELSRFPVALVTGGTPETFAALEAIEAGCTNPRLRKLDRHQLVARPIGRGWIAIFCRDDTIAIHARLAVTGIAEFQTNPNFRTQETSDDE